MREKDPAKRREISAELQAIAANRKRAEAHLLRTFDDRGPASGGGSCLKLENFTAIRCLAAGLPGLMPGYERLAQERDREIKQKSQNRHVYNYCKKNVGLKRVHTRDEQVT